jgi:hypothetical protein
MLNKRPREKGRADILFIPKINLDNCHRTSLETQKDSPTAAAAATAKTTKAVPTKMTMTSRSHSFGHGNNNTNSNDDRVGDTVGTPNGSGIVRVFGSTTHVPDSDYCRLSYYLKCCILGCGIDFVFDLSLLDYQGDVASRLDQQGQEQLFHLAHTVFRVDILLNKVIFLDDENVLLPQGVSNAFYHDVEEEEETTTVDSQFIQSQSSENPYDNTTSGRGFHLGSPPVSLSAEVEGRRPDLQQHHHQSLKVMLCSTQWLDEFYVGPISRLQPWHRPSRQRPAVVGDESPSPNLVWSCPDTIPSSTTSYSSCRSRGSGDKQPLRHYGTITDPTEPIHISVFGMRIVEPSSHVLYDVICPPSDRFTILNTFSNDVAVIVATDNDDDEDDGVYPAPPPPLRIGQTVRLGWIASLPQVNGQLAIIFEILEDCRYLVHVPCISIMLSVSTCNMMMQQVAWS